MTSPLEDVRRLTIGQLAALVRNIGGPVNVEAILRCGDIRDEVGDIIRKHLAPVAPSLTARVTYGNPDHHRLKRDQYRYIEGGLSSADFPVRGTEEADVTYEYVTFDHEPTTQEVLDEIGRRGNLRVPDFAETRDFHAQNPGEREKGWIMSLCGVVTRRGGDPGVALVDAYVHGLDLDWGWLDTRWRQARRFLAVRQA